MFPLETLLSPINFWSRILIRLKAIFVGEGKTVTNKLGAFVNSLQLLQGSNMDVHSRTEVNERLIETLEEKPRRGGGGGNSYMKQMGMLVVLPRGAII